MTSSLVSIAGKTIFSLLVLLVMLVDPVNATDRPNVVLISVDDLNDLLGIFDPSIVDIKANLHDTIAIIHF